MDCRVPHELWRLSCRRFELSPCKAHNTNGTPHIAVTMSSLFVFLVPASMSLFGLKILDVYGYLGTIATYGFLLTYILISVAAPISYSWHFQIASSFLGFIVRIRIQPLPSTFYLPSPSPPCHLMGMLMISIAPIESRTNPKLRFIFTR